MTIDSLKEQEKDLIPNGPIGKYRKKPVVIEAYQLHAGPIEIKTLEGTMTAEPEDWVITGVKGEQYPCKPDIFKATYDKV